MRAVEKIDVIFDNMQLTAGWLQTRFTDTQKYIEAETDVMNKKIDGVTDEIDEIKKHVKGVAFDLQVTVLSKEAKTLACVITKGGVAAKADVMEITGFANDGTSRAISNFKQKKMGSDALMITLPKESKMTVFVVTAGITDPEVQKQVLVSL